MDFRAFLLILMLLQVIDIKKKSEQNFVFAPRKNNTCILNLWTSAFEYHKGDIAIFLKSILLTGVLSLI